jgi:outer membrane scaffolding protein for murein synthesis (MipA/OmpV family)
MKATYILVLLLALTLTSGSVWAAGMIGLGAGSAPDYEGSDDYQAVPMFLYNQTFESGRYVKLMGPNLKVNLLTSKSYSLGPVLNYHPERNHVDNNQVDKMDKVDAALEAGVFGGVAFDNFLLDIEFLADVSSSHDGFTIQPAAGYRWKLSSSLTLTPKVFMTYASEDYMSTYFGLNSGNRGTSTLPNYNADAGIKDVGFNLVANFTPWENWGFMGIWSYKTLLNDAEDSPIVDDEGNDNQFAAALMVTYRWGN